MSVPATPSATATQPGDSNPFNAAAGAAEQASAAASAAASALTRGAASLFRRSVSIDDDFETRYEVGCWQIKEFLFSCNVQK